MVNNLLTELLESSIITTMNSQTIKIWKSTLKRLRMIYALTGERMVAILDRLVTAELGQIQKRSSNEYNDM